MNKKAKDFFHKVCELLEIVIIVLIALAIIFSIKGLISYYPGIYGHRGGYSLTGLSDFLSHALELIVGIELILTIVNTSLNSILELTLMVIVRKMLIHSTKINDLLLASLAIAIVVVSIVMSCQRVKGGEFFHKNFIKKSNFNKDQVKIEEFVPGMIVEKKDKSYEVVEVDDGKVTKVKLVDE